MEDTSKAFDWEGRHLQLHAFHRMHKDFRAVPVELFYVAAAPFSGPIATLRDRSVPTELTIPEELQNNIAFFSHKGKLLRRVPFTTEHRVITFSFTNEEVLLVVLNTGQYYLVDPFRGSSMKEFRLDASFNVDTLLLCKTIDSRLYFLSTNKRIYEVKNIFQPIAKEIILLAVRLDNPVMHINSTEGGVVDVVYLHESNEIYSWHTNELVLSCEYLTDRRSKLVYLNRRMHH